MQAVFTGYTRSSYRHPKFGRRGLQMLVIVRCNVGLLECVVCNDLFGAHVLDEHTTS